MIYDIQQATAKAEELIRDNEGEVVEFKEARQSFDTDLIGRYFSALSNEANLRSLPCGWLVFGVADDGAVCGTNYRNDGTGKSSKGLMRLKHEIAEHTSDRMVFSEVYELALGGKRVLLFQVPAARPGSPTTWKKAAFERAGDRLEPLSLPKLDEIRSQRGYDWSGLPAFGASAADLDDAAVDAAVERYARHLGTHAAVVSQMSRSAVLEKMGALVDGVPTNAGLLLLGREEARARLDGQGAKITWTLYRSNGTADSYEHLGMPLLLSADRLISLVRNVRFQMFADPGSPDPVSLLHYEPDVLRELTYNCLAHQDYALRGRVNVLEYEDRLVFVNEGSFIPGSIDRALEDGYRPPRYRNPALTELMVSLGLIDTASLGIPRVFAAQARRCLPLPDYDLSEPDRVRVTVYGSPIDITYSRIMRANPGLPLRIARILDRVQKGLPVDDASFAEAGGLGLLSGTPEEPVLVEPDARAAAAQGAGEGEAATLSSGELDELVLSALRGERGMTRAAVIGEIARSSGLDLSGDRDRKRVTRSLTRLEAEGRVLHEGASRARVWKVAGTAAP